MLSAVLYTLSILTVGVLISGIPCIFCCCKKYKPKTYINKWSISLFMLIIAWSLPCFIWFLYSPINVCTNKIVYSYPDTSLHTKWTPFWCSQKCDSEVVYPDNVTHLQNIIINANRIRAVGGGHSSTELQCTNGTIVVIQDNFCSYDGVDNNSIATFGSGCSVEEAMKYLLRKNLQFYGFGGIAQQRLGGAISTSLHGQHTMSFSDNVVGITSILANGTIINIEKNNQFFNAWKSSLGRLGVITKIKIKVFPLQFVKCSTVETNYSHLNLELNNTNIVGFEAKRFLQNEIYIVRTCYEESYNSNITYENKNSKWDGFIVDNIALPLVMLFGSTLTNSELFAQLMIKMNSVATSRNSIVPTINDYRVPISFNPHFDEEYSIPVERCHLTIEKIKQTFPDLHIHAYIRRVDYDNSWLTWVPQNSCAIRLEYYDYNRIDFVEFERNFRFQVEEIVINNNGSGHRGKLWYRHASELFKNTLKSQQFENYRQQIDPNSKFENLFTEEMKKSNQRLKNSLPFELQTRAFTWRLFVWIAVGINVFIVLLICILLGKRVQINDVTVVKQDIQLVEVVKSKHIDSVREKEMMKRRLQEKR